MSVGSLKHISCLPPLTGITRDLIEALNKCDREVDIQKLVILIESDPPLAAKILSMANSAMFNTGKDIILLQDAVIRLGMQSTKGLIISISLSGMFDTRLCPLFEPKRYWCDALTTALYARKLAVSLGRTEQAEKAYLMGLLNRIGLYVLVYLLPQEMIEVFNRFNQRAAPLSVLECETLSLDHYKAGQQLLSVWSLPQEIIDSCQPGGTVLCEDLQASRYLVALAKGVIEGMSEEALPDGLNQDQIDHLKHSSARELERLQEMVQLVI